MVAFNERGKKGQHMFSIKKEIFSFFLSFVGNFFLLKEGEKCKADLIKAR